MTSFLTQAEIDHLQTGSLSRDTPFAIQGVSCGYFSIARYYGGVKFNGQRYTYFDESDELIRDDVLKEVSKWRKKRKAVKP